MAAPKGAAFPDRIDIHSGNVGGESLGVCPGLLAYKAREVENRPSRPD
ncbi:hypothetical protein [Brevundimonas sp.]|nr:hypothetical protein [Brevundimonas sp.]